MQANHAEPRGEELGIRDLLSKFSHVRKNIYNAGGQSIVLWQSEHTAYRTECTAPFVCTFRSFHIRIAHKANKN